MPLLHLNLKGEYFEAIRSGKKKEEYRLYSEYWRKRLIHREYGGILLKKGYPKRDDKERILERIWRGWDIKTITHPHFGGKPVQVFAIKVNQ